MKIGLSLNFLIFLLIAEKKMLSVETQYATYLAYYQQY